jgi:hypothetical protein
LFIDSDDDIAFIFGIPIDISLLIIDILAGLDSLTPNNKLLLSLGNDLTRLAKTTVCHTSRHSYLLVYSWIPLY